MSCRVKSYQVGNVWPKRPTRRDRDAYLGSNRVRKLDDGRKRWQKEMAEFSLLDRRWKWGVERGGKDQERS